MIHQDVWDDILLFMVFQLLRQYYMQIGKTRESRKERQADLVIQKELLHSGYGSS